MTKTSKSEWKNGGIIKLIQKAVETQNTRYINYYYCSFFKSNFPA